MTPDELARALGVVRAAAMEAAKLVSNGFRRHVAVEHKGAIDLVTEYDRASEALLRQRLTSELPYAFVGEEGGGDLENGVGFYVDPIDGTTNFVHGHPFWCISIGLVARGAPVLGLVLAPALGVEWSGWTAANGERSARRHTFASAFLPATESACAPSRTAAIAEAYLATGFPYDRRTSDDDNFAAFTTIKKKCLAIRRCGSAAMDVCLVADGTYDGYWERKVNPYDVAGGAAIARAAGCTVTDFTGGAAFLERGRIVVTNGALHGALVAELAHTG
ncbi:MAG: inositol monophosphatase [Labilithrix sp.]|nr:inositol monophosphatase [Labilithrix sp.]MCW5818120.1 inositol monophosphatase [Labilithrix sp.]